MNLSPNTVLVWRNDALLTLTLGRLQRVPGKDEYALPVEVVAKRGGAHDTAWVHLSGMAAHILGGLDDQVGIGSQPDSITAVLPAMVVFEAALRYWPDRKLTTIRTADLRLASYLAEPTSEDEIVAKLGRLLLKVGDYEERITSVGAALSLGESLTAVRRAARTLHTEDLLDGSPALHGDAKLDAYRPESILVWWPKKRAAMRKFLLDHERFARLPIRFDFTRLHPSIANAARPDFENERFDLAQFAALRQVSLMVRGKAGVDLDRDRGRKSMTRIWARDRSQHQGHAALRIGGDSESDRNLHDGLQALFEGAQTLSNPVRHSEPHLGGNADEAFEYIVLASLLARAVDRATVADATPVALDGQG